MLQAFNHEDVISFLNRCYKAEEKGTVKDETSVFRDLTVLHICAFHALRRVKTYTSRNTKGKGKFEVSKLAVDAYRALLRTDSRQEAEKVIRLIATVFGRKKKSSHVENAIKDLQRIQEEHVRRMKIAKANLLNPHDAAHEFSEDPDDMVSFYE